MEKVNSNLHINEIEVWADPRNAVTDMIKRHGFDDTDGATIDMTSYESSFLCGVLKKFRPQKLLEVGVDRGGSTAVIMEAMSSLRPDGFELASVDYRKKVSILEDGCTREASVGYCGIEEKKILEGQGKKFSWELCLGNVSVSFIDRIGDNIDCLILDTSHTLPGEVLDFICLLPYLKDGCVVILHDICLSLQDYSPVPYYACAQLFSNVTAEKYLNWDTSFYRPYPNIGAFVVNEDTRRNISDLFLAFMIPWGSGTFTRRQIQQYRTHLDRFYTEDMTRLFDLALSMNLDHEAAKYHFPFYLLPAGSRIVIYGGTVMGMAYHAQLESYQSQSGDSLYTLAGWIDRNNISDIRNLQYDFIVLAVVYGSAMKAKRDLMALGVPEEKIVNNEFPGDRFIPESTYLRASLQALPFDRRIWHL